MSGMCVCRAPLVNLQCKTGLHRVPAGSMNYTVYNRSLEIVQRYIFKFVLLVREEGSVSTMPCTIVLFLQRLPASLQARIADTECRHTMNRNTHVFANCNEQFLARFMTMLAEVSLMPGEQLLQQGDMARQLSFATKGTLVVQDTKGTLIELISGEGTSACIVGAVSFLLGAPPVTQDSCSFLTSPATSSFNICAVL